MESFEKDSGGVELENVERKNSFVEYPLLMASIPRARSSPCCARPQARFGQLLSPDREGSQTGAVQKAEPQMVALIWPQHLD